MRDTTGTEDGCRVQMAIESDTTRRSGAGGGYRQTMRDTRGTGGECRVQMAITDG